MFLLAHSIPQAQHLGQTHVQVRAKNVLQHKQTDAQLRRAFELFIAVGRQVGQQVLELRHIDPKRSRQLEQCLKIRCHPPWHRTVIDHNGNHRPQPRLLAQAVLPTLHHVAQHLQG